MVARICLNMIVKNEAANIVRCLASVRPLVDCAVIVDTGSTDQTPELIEAFCFRENLPLWLTRGAQFTTWDKTRNLALDIALDNMKFDYFLFCDADMEAFGTLDDENLTAVCYALRQRHESLEWRNHRLVRRDANPRYVGATHEYLSIDGVVEDLDSLWFYDYADGANRPGKFERDIKLLTDSLKTDPDNPRTWYYLGQSYRDARKDEQAIIAFKKRLAIGGWDEETFYSMLELARAERRIG